MLILLLGNMFRVCELYLYLSLAEVPEPTMRDLANLVQTDKPYLLGLQLNLENHRLRVVEVNHPRDLHRQVLEVFSLYLRQSLSPSWVEVATALWNIGEKRTANAIAHRYGMNARSCT